MFQHRVEAFFFSNYILHNDKPLWNVTDHAIKIEFQQRGSPHVHCLLWVKDASHIDLQSDEDVFKFIDLFVSGMIPEDTAESKNIWNMVISLQTHKHSQYCWRSVGTYRFAFPNTPSPHVLICREQHDDNHDDLLIPSHKVLGKVKKILAESDEQLTLEELL